MKTKLLFVSFVLLFATSLQAQYYFTHSAGSYSDLTSSTSVNNGETWDDPTYTVPIGFNFDLYGTPITEIVISGWWYGGMLTTQTDEVGILPIIMAYGADIIDRGDYSGTSLSNISYKVEGTSGSQIFKLEWNNVGFYSDLYGYDEDYTSTDFTNFQLWFHEGSNDMSIHFGPNNITQPEDIYFNGVGSSVEITEGYDFENYAISGDAMSLEGDPASPSVINPADLFETYLNGPIPNGTIYTFSTTPIGVNESVAQDLDFAFYPNPVGDQMQLITTGIKEKIQSLEILDLQGRLVAQYAGNVNTIDTKLLNGGTYFLQLRTQSGVIQKKFLKK